MADTAPQSNNVAIKFQGRGEMPLDKSSSDAARSKNIATEINAGRDPKQAEAIAYSVQRKADGLRKRGLISDRQAEKRGLAMKRGPSDGETEAVMQETR